jgi:hypothetical protein
MSICGYFSKNSRLRMPRAVEGEPDKNGFRFFGPVLTGKLSVEEAVALADREAAIKAKAKKR